jgi:hypothetical protein
LIYLSIEASEMATQFSLNEFLPIELVIILLQHFIIISLEYFL